MPHSTLAIVFLVLLAAAVALWIIWGLRQNPYTVGQSVLYFVSLLQTRIQWRCEIPRALPIPPGEGALVVCNHRSSVDPFFVQAAAHRVVHWMVAREYCEHPWFRWFLRAVGAIPVNRAGIDTAATKLSIRIASQGGAIGMFPEGRINMSDQFMLPGRPGAILVALRAKVPIIPCYIEGSPYAGSAWSPFLMRARVKVKFGAPMDLSAYADEEPDKQSVEQLMLMCLTEIAKLAGATEFQPTLAGRRWKPEEVELQSSLARKFRRG